MASILRFSDVLPIAVDEVMWNILERVQRIITRRLPIPLHLILPLEAIANVSDDKIDGMFLQLICFIFDLPGWSWFFSQYLKEVSVNPWL